MNRYIKTATPIVLFLSIWAILFFSGRYMLYLQEQLQLFQNNWDYFIENCTYHAGFAQMVTEFIIQFCYIPWLGCLILAGVITAGIYMLKSILRKLGVSKGLTPIAIIPTIPLIYSLVTSEVTFAYIQFFIAIAISSIVMKVKYKYQYIVGTISAPLLFWLCGAPAILLPIFIAISSFTKGNRGKYAILNLIPLVTYIAFGVIGVRTGLIGSFNHFLNHTVTKIPLKTLREAQPMVMVGWASTIIVALYGILQNRFEKLVEYGWLNQITQFALVVVMGGVVLFAPDKQYSAGITFKEYNKWAKLHYLYTQQEYKQLLNLYKTEAPDGTIESNYINLALYREGRLMDDFFKYSPTNHMSLLIRWADAPFPIAFLWGEVSVSSEMGFILKSCQTAYEGNVLSGPRGSSAFTKILVESEIILGNYKTADKYISNLENTIFYKDWATSQREFLSDKAVSQNDYYKVKRKCLLKDNAVMALTDELKLMEHIYRVNPAHKSTYNFATLMTLSSGAIPAFREVISIGMESRHFMPPFHKIIQEGLTVAYNQYPVFWNFYKIDENIQKQYLEFGKAVKERNANPMGANAVISKNQNRYWYYIETLRQRSQQANQNTIETTTELPNN